MSQILDRLRRGLFVQCVVVYRVAQSSKVSLQHGLLRVQYNLVVLHCRYSDEDRNDHNDDHQFDERKPIAANAATALLRRLTGFPGFLQ